MAYSAGLSATSRTASVIPLQRHGRGIRGPSKRASRCYNGHWQGGPNTVSQTKLSAKQLAQLAKEGAKTPSNQQVQGVKATGGMVQRRSDGKVVVQSD
jgi:hypothetical protein